MTWSLVLLSCSAQGERSASEADFGCVEEMLCGRGINRTPLVERRVALHVRCTVLDCTIEAVVSTVLTRLTQEHCEPAPREWAEDAMPCDAMCLRDQTCGCETVARLLPR